MRNYSWIVVSALLLSGLPAITGCDDTKEKHETVQQKSDGTVVHDKQETKEKSDGTVVKEEKHTVDHPNQ